MKIGRIMVEEDFIEERHIEEILSFQKDSEKLFGQLAVESGFATVDQVLTAWSQQIDIPFVKIPEKNISRSVLEEIPQNVAREYKILPVSSNNGSLQIAMEDPLDLTKVDELSQVVGEKIDPVIGNPEDIELGIERLYGNREQSTDNPSTVGSSNDSIIKLLDELIQQALEERATDIHIEPESDEVVVRYRIDGVLYKVRTLNKNKLRPLVSRVKVMADLDIAEKRLPQDGKIRTTVSGKEIDLRVSVLPTSYGEGCVIRLLDKDNILLGLDELGFSPQSLGLFEQQLHHSHGLILVTGPTGSGKTTTLYAALNQLNQDDTKIVTIEDPIEYDLAGIQQIQVKKKIGLDFARGLRSILRHDPDIILVGEIRDEETAEIAIQSALTGHLVFATLHTNNAPGAVTRLLDMGIENYLVASSIIGVLAQRLVRKNCPRCKTEEPFTQTGEFDSCFNGAIYRGEGCEYCKDTGYRGRTAIVENMKMTDEIKTLIKESAATADIQEQARNDGMKTLKEDGLRKIKEGITTPEEVLRVANE